MRIAVIGAGVIGLSTTKSLLASGEHEVRCYESANPMGARSVGDTRLFRTSHKEAEMIEFAVKARAAWADWSTEAGRPLLNETGLLVNLPYPQYRLALLNDAGVPAEIVHGTDSVAPLTTHTVAEPLLHDPWAGAIQARETGCFLLNRCRSIIVPEAVERIEIIKSEATVHTANDSWTCDSVLILAGFDTARLAVTCGMDLLIELIIATRFTFRMNDPAAVVPAWFDEYENLFMWGFTPRPGHWATGINLPDERKQVELGREVVEATALKALRHYIDRRLDRLDPSPVDGISCVADPDGDGIYAKRSGPVLALWGDNLFKFAPVLGQALSTAAVDLDLPNIP